jgi:hypothetical protein
MQKHAGKQGEKCRDEANVPVKEGRNAGWDRRVGQFKRFGSARGQGILIEKYCNIREDERNVHDRITSGRIVVLEGYEHGERSRAE